MVHYSHDILGFLNFITPCIYNLKFLYAKVISLRSRIFYKKILFVIKLKIKKNHFVNPHQLTQCIANIIIIIV